MIFFRLTTLIFLFFYTALVHAIPPAVDVKMKAALQAFMEQHHLPGMSVQVYQAGHAQHFYLGYADLKKKAPVSSQTMFPLGSLSAIVSNLLLAKQIDDAKLSLKSPLSQYINSLPNEISHLTLLDLATQKTGLPTTLKTNQQKIVLEYLQTVHFKENAGEYVQMTSNSAFDYYLLMYVLQVANKKTNAAIYKQQLLPHLNLKSLTLTHQKIATGYQLQNGTQEVLSSKEAPKSLYLSAADMQILLKAAIGINQTDDILYPMRLTQSSFLKLPEQHYGLGWHIYTTKNGHYHFPDFKKRSPIIKSTSFPLFHADAYFERVSSRKGYSAYIAVLPKTQSGIAIMTNQQLPPEVLAKFARELLLNNKMETNKRV